MNKISLLTRFFFFFFRSILYSIKVLFEVYVRKQIWNPKRRSWWIVCFWHFESYDYMPMSTTIITQTLPTLQVPPIFQQWIAKTLTISAWIRMHSIPYRTTKIFISKLQENHIIYSFFLHIYFPFYSTSIFTLDLNFHCRFLFLFNFFFRLNQINCICVLSHQNFSFSFFFSWFCDCFVVISSHLRDFRFIHFIHVFLFKTCKKKCN